MSGLNINKESIMNKANKEIKAAIKQMFNGSKNLNMSKEATT
jgi:hypothetical protein